MVPLVIACRWPRVFVGRWLSLPRSAPFYVSLCASLCVSCVCVCLLVCLLPARVSRGRRGGADRRGRAVVVVVCAARDNLPLKLIPPPFVRPFVPPSAIVYTLPPLPREMTKVVAVCSSLLVRWLVRWFDSCGCLLPPRSTVCRDSRFVCEWYWHAPRRRSGWCRAAVSPLTIADSLTR